MNIVANPVNGFYTESVPEIKNRTTTESWPISGNSYLLELITGEPVIDLLFSNSAFQKSWDRLYESCPWATVFQGRQFVATFYKVYLETHLPILIIAAEKGQLKGVLPMVLLDTPASNPHSTGKQSRITGAGHYEAQYQVWLAAPADGETFIKKALAQLMKQFPGHPVSFRFLPPGTPLNWTKNDPQWQKCSITQLHTRPLINFNAPDHTRLFNKKHFKHKLNRMKKLGEVCFECIRDPEVFESSLDEMALLYDFRQSALFNKSPFREDAEKKDFLLELFRLHLLHVTVLKLNGKIVAAVVAVTGKNGWVHLAGINCHSPVKARWYSPGFMHFILLFKQLAEEQVQYFDLTPGYDAYKDELANGQDEVTELVISNKPKFRMKRKLKKWLHARLVAAGIRPMTMELALKKYNYQVRHWSARSVINKLTAALYKKRKQQLYFIQADNGAPAINISLHKDSLSDLMEYQPRKGRDMPGWDFLSNAMYRLERGQHCYTWMENGRLLCCAWISYPETGPLEKNNDTDTENVVVLEKLYCHAAGKDRLPAFLNRMATAIDAVVNKERNGLYVLANDPVFCRTLTSAGFRAV